ncbi:MAG TPA: hypothetical protein VIM39_02900 [Candidatus Limnocylindrales bacterium]
MHSKPALVLISIASVALGACTSGASPSAPTARPAATQIAVATLTASAVPVESTSPTASSTGEPAPSSGGGGAQPTPGSIDPCSLLTAAEASTAIGKKLSAGVSTQLDPDRACTFKDGLTEVKIILAPPAPDATTAQADWDEARSQVPADIPVKDLTYFDRSAYGSGSAAGASLSALFVIDGTNFFDFYCGFPACSQDASVSAAQLIAGRLP